MGAGVGQVRAAAGATWRPGWGRGASGRRRGALAQAVATGYRSPRSWRGVAFLVIEDRLGVRPPHGFVVLGDGTRERVDNTPALRAWVLDLAGQIRTARAAINEPIPIAVKAGRNPHGASNIIKLILFNKSC